MRCPFCRHSDCRVIDSREVDDGQATRRRRSCAACGRRFTTVEEAVLAVVKRSGVTEPFSRDKVVDGVRRACQGRPVDEDSLQQLAHRVEEAVRAGGTAEVPSHEVGLAILGPLRELDEVAYLRFASVYRSFSSIEDFEKEIAATPPPGRPVTRLTSPARTRPSPGSSAPPHPPPSPATSRGTDGPSPPVRQKEGKHVRDRRDHRARPRAHAGREAGPVGRTVHRADPHHAGRAPV